MWDKDTQAVYDLLMTQMQNASADYSNSVDTLVKFAKQQKNKYLMYKAFNALLQAGRYAEAVDITKFWKSHSKNNNTQKFYVLALVLNEEVDKAVGEVKGQLKKHPSDSQKEVLFDYVKVIMSKWYYPATLDVISRFYADYPDHVTLRPMLNC